jgi:hypothetical protein
MRTVFVIGLVLLLLSAYPLYWMAMEIIVSERAYRRYSMQQQSGTNYDCKSAEFNGHRATFSDGPILNGKSSILTTIDGKDYSLRSPVELDDRGGYNSWAAMVTLTNLQANQPMLAVLQRVAGNNYPEDTRYRILFVRPDGHITEEWFNYGERDVPAYRAMLAQYVHPEPLGIKSQAMTFWPTIYYPILYPWGSGLLGFLSSVIAGIFILFRRSRRRSLAIS